MRCGSENKIVTAFIFYHCYNKSPAIQQLRITQNYYKMVSIGQKSRSAQRASQCWNRGDRMALFLVGISGVNHSGCWQNSVLCHCRTEVSFSFLTTSEGSLSASRGHLCFLITAFNAINCELNSSQASILFHLSITLSFVSLFHQNLSNSTTFFILKAPVIALSLGLPWIIFLF